MYVDDDAHHDVRTNYCNHILLCGGPPPLPIKELIFAGTKFREFHGFWDHLRNLIPAKRKNLTIREI